MKNQRVLVIMPNWIGDAVMAQPLLQLLQTQYPDVQIDVMATAWVAQVVRAMPEVTEVIQAPFRHGVLQLRERLNFARKLRSQNYSAAYILPNTFKFALLPWLARIPLRIGYKGESRYGLINRMHFDDKQRPRAMTRFYAALAYPPVDSFTAEVPKPKLVVKDDDLNAALSTFGLTRSQRIVIFAPGAEFGNAKRWPVEHFASLGQRLREADPKVQIILMGSAKDTDICAQVKSGLPDAQILAGKTDLFQAVSLIAAADLMVSNDSGLLHIASSLNRPVAAIYGPTDPAHAPPFSDMSWSFNLSLDCMPCKQRECPLGHHQCMRNLMPDSVADRIQSSLRWN
ncbi:lipopolysaccharide heptosyltransferase II [Undibacterium luofuense]|uniref:lipopolysaccharide heptosyltransferase II n=1 Tax=Undibacterium luofuense TaxID=2828733 RepID=A0A941DIR8_9BURK|nr:lipopolysaccharide heptosyltransferase II [Undibacterium luofuense]MBR7781488.1 lipopolysaccharide heptosyltransferase II [Undibacterium luofuense]